MELWCKLEFTNNWNTAWGVLKTMAWTDLSWSSAQKKLKAKLSLWSLHNIIKMDPFADSQLSPLSNALGSRFLSQGEYGENFVGLGQKCWQKSATAYLKMRREWFLWAWAFSQKVNVPDKSVLNDKFCKWGRPFSKSFDGFRFVFQSSETSCRFETVLNQKQTMSPKAQLAKTAIWKEGQAEPA